MTEFKNVKTEGYEDALDGFQLFDTPETEGEEEIGSRWVMIKGKEYAFVATNPYGHFHITPKKGTLPEELRGKYTSVGEAERHIIQVMNIKEDREAKKAIRKEVDPVMKEKLVQKRTGKKPAVSSGLEVA